MHSDRLLSTCILLDNSIAQMSRVSEQVASVNYSFLPLPPTAVFPITSASSRPYTIRQSTGSHTLLTQVNFRHPVTV